MKSTTHTLALILMLTLLTAFGCKDNKGHAVDGAEDVKVLVLYTPEALSAAEDRGYHDFETIIHERINYTNGAFMQSGVAHQLVLTGTMLAPSETVIAEAMEVSTLRQNKVRGWMTRQLNDDDSDIHQERHHAEADLLVIMHGPLSGATSGQARVTSGDEELDYERSHAAVTWSSSNTFAHEIGHLFGAEHDEYRLESVNVTPNTDYAQGYVDVEAGFRTMMAYAGACTDADVSCSRVPLFSNPNIEKEGAAIGDQSSAYNACVLARRGGYVASFYEFWSGNKEWSRERLPRNCEEEILPLD
jgi:hypothetical protein